MSLTTEEYSLVLRAGCCLAAADGRLTRQEISCISGVLQSLGVPACYLTDEKITSIAQATHRVGGNKAASAIRSDLEKHRYRPAVRDAIRRLLRALAEQNEKNHNPARALLDLLDLPSDSVTQEVSSPRHHGSPTTRIALLLVASAACLMVCAAVVFLRHELRNSPRDATIVADPHDAIPGGSARELTQGVDASSGMISPKETSTVPPVSTTAEESAATLTQTGKANEDPAGQATQSLPANVTSQRANQPDAEVLGDNAKRNSADPDVRNSRWLQTQEEVAATETSPLTRAELGRGVTVLRGMDTLGGHECEFYFGFIDDALIEVAYQFQGSADNAYTDLSSMLRKKYGEPDDRTHELEHIMKNSAEEDTNLAKGLLALDQIMNHSCRWTTARHLVWLREDSPGLVTIKFTASDPRAEQLRQEADQRKKDADARDAGRKL